MGTGGLIERGPLRQPAAQAASIAIGAGTLGALYLAVMTLRAGDSMHFDVTALSVGFAFVSGLAIAAGVAAAIGLGELAVGGGFALAAALLVIAILAIFSVGLLVLPIALIALAVAVRRLLRRRSRRAARGAVAGVIVGIAAVAYLLVLNQPAVAECRTNGSATSSGGLFGSTAVSSGGFSVNGGDAGGYIDEGDRIAYFSCHDGKLTDFHRESLPQGQWTVTTQPAATTGRTVMIVFRVRPTAGMNVPTDGGFDFSVTCRTCAEPRPVVRGHASLTGPREPAAGRSVMFAAQIEFPAAGSWFTAPYDAPLEVR